MTERPLVVERYLKADCDAVFRAWTDPRIVAEWFFVAPNWEVSIDNDLRVGGKYALTMVTAEGEQHVMRGEYLELDRPRRLSFTWSSHVVEHSRVVIELEPSGDGTLLRLEHYLVSDAKVRGAHQAGWKGCLDNLERLTASERQV